MNRTATIAEATTPFLYPNPYGKPSEIVIGIAYITLMIIGIPSNIISVLYFSNQAVSHNTTKEYFKWIYANIATMDFCICLFCFPVVTVFFNDERDSELFHNSFFCKIWGFLWEIVPYYSVFLVLVLTVSRMLILVRPMIVLSKKALFSTLVIYNIFLVLAKVAFYLAEITQMDFTKRDGLCILTFVEKNAILYPIYTFLNIFLLALPVLPICICCIISISRMHATDKAVQSTRKGSNKEETGQRVRTNISHNRHRRASVTVIIMTLTYIIFNLPVFMNYVLYGVWSAMSWTKRPMAIEVFYYNTFLYYYSWNLCLVLFVVTNAALNPLIYASRMNDFRQSVIDDCKNARSRWANTYNMSTNNIIVFSK